MTPWVTEGRASWRLLGTVRMVVATYGSLGLYEAKVPVLGPVPGFVVIRELPSRQTAQIVADNMAAEIGWPDALASAHRGEARALSAAKGRTARPGAPPADVQRRLNNVLVAMATGKAMS